MSKCLLICSIEIMTKGMPGILLIKISESRLCLLHSIIPSAEWGAVRYECWQLRCVVTGCVRRDWSRGCLYLACPLSARCQVTVRYWYLCKGEHSSGGRSREIFRLVKNWYFWNITSIVLEAWRGRGNAVIFKLFVRDSSPYGRSIKESHSSEDNKNIIN